MGLCSDYYDNPRRACALPHRATLAGAEVLVVYKETGQQRGAVTDAEGRYRILGLVPGLYDVTARYLGYRSSTRTDVQLVVGQRATLTFTLFPEAIQVQAVEVVAERAGSFEIQRMDVSIPVLRQEILSLPLDTRNTMNLAAIAPGIRSYATIGGRSLPSAGAVPDLRFINLYVDGSEWKSLFNGNIVGIPQTGSPLPPEALQEFRVYLNTYDAEYARGGAYIISAVTRRGTNTLEGSAFVYYQNKALQDINAYQRDLEAQGRFRRPDFYNRQQVGFNLRGRYGKIDSFLRSTMSLVARLMLSRSVRAGPPTTRIYGKPMRGGSPPRFTITPVCSASPICPIPDTRSMLPGPRAIMRTNPSSAAL